MVGVVLTLSSLPHLLGPFMLQPGDATYLGVNPLGAADTAVYFSLVRQAAHGEVFAINSYTSEAQAGSLFHPLWLVLGWVAGLSHLPVPLIFHGARVILGAALLLFVYAFLCRMFVSVRTRTIAFALIAFSSGFGWAFGSLTLNDPTIVELLLPTDRWVSESNTFLTFFHSPLFPLSQLLMLAVFWYWMDEARFRSFVFPAALFGLLAVIHPYDTVTVLAVCAATAVVRRARDPSFSAQDFRRQIRRGLLLLAVAAPPLLQLWVATRIEPAIGGWAEQNVTLSPPFHSYLAGYGLLVPFAILGWALLRRSRTPRILFLLTWVVVNLALLYAPLQMNRRFSNGLHLALSMLAAVAIAAIVTWWERRPKARRWEYVGHVALWVGIIGFFLSNLVLVGSAIDWLRNPFGRSVSYLSQEAREAFQWLDASARPGAVVLSASRLGNLLPVMTGMRAYIGHGHQTTHFQEKTKRVLWLVKERNTEEERKRFFRDAKIEYLLFVSSTKFLFKPENESYLERVFQEGEMEIYAVRSVR